MLMFYGKQLLRYEEENPFFWNWYREQKEQKKGLVWWEQNVEYKNIKKIISDGNDIIEYKKYQRSALKNMENKQESTLKYIGNNQNKQNYFPDKRVVRDQIKINNIFDKEQIQYQKKEQKKYQKQYEYEKQYQRQKQRQQRYDVKEKYKIKEQEQYDIEKKNRYSVQKQQKEEKQKENEQVRQEEKQEQKEREQQKKEKQQQQSIWEKEKLLKRYHSNVEEQKYSIVKEKEVKKEKEIMIDVREKKEKVRNNNFWNYGNFLNNETKEMEVNSIFWLGENAIQWQQNNSNYVYYDNKKRNLEKNVQNNKVEDILSNEKKYFTNDSKKVKSIWKKYEEKQMIEKSQKINVEMVKNIVKNSLAEKEEQRQKQEQIQSEEKSINIDNIFLNMTERLLEQRERSLRRNILKI